MFSTPDCCERNPLLSVAVHVTYVIKSCKCGFNASALYYLVLTGKIVIICLCEQVKRHVYDG